MEGCWLKDGVPPPVEDGCCISGVKTGETVSVAIREPSQPAGDAGQKPVPADDEGAVPKPSAKQAAGPKERIPATGSGKRIFAGMNFAAVSPKGPEATPNARFLGIPSAREVGAGRKEITGMDFSAASPAAAVRSAPERVVQETPAAGTGTGLREIGRVHYSASPRSAAKNVRTGSATRKVSGVDITAVPPNR